MKLALLHKKEILTIADTPGLLILLQVLQMLVLVVIAFAICWAPWQTYFLAAIIHPPVNQ